MNSLSLKLGLKIEAPLRVAQLTRREKPVLTRLFRVAEFIFLSVCVDIYIIRIYL